MRVQVAGVALLVLGLSACGEDSTEGVTNYKSLERFIADHKVGEDADRWIEMRNLSGEWERVGLIFGYVGDNDECLKAIAGLKNENYSREYRCAAANGPVSPLSNAVAEPLRPKGVIELRTDRNGSIWKIDADSVRGPRKARQSWVIIDSSKDKTVSYAEERVLFQVDCETTAARQLSSGTYARDGRSLTGTSASPESAKVEYWPPRTMGSAALNYICESKFDEPAR